MTGVKRVLHVCERWCDTRLMEPFQWFGIRLLYALPITHADHSIRSEVIIVKSNGRILHFTGINR